MDDISLPEEYIFPRHCSLCNTWYKEKQNIGRLLCRIHPGLKLCDERGKIYYSCCGFYYDDFANNSVMSIDALGCMPIDHTDISFDDTNLVSRLNEIKSFIIVTIPIILWDMGVERPLSHRLLYSSNTNDSTSAPPITYHLDVFDQILTNSASLISLHSPYARTYELPLINHDNKEEEKKKLSTIVIDMRKLSIEMNKTELALEIKALKETPWSLKSLSKQTDAWADYDVIEPSLVKHGRKRENNLPFVVIQRIGDRLNIIPSYSKLCKM